MEPHTNISQLYKRAAASGLVHPSDANAIRRAQRAYRRNLQEPGDCAGDYEMLAALAVAQADIGIRPGWIPDTQMLAIAIADTMYGTE